MFALPNKKRKLLAYFCYIININSYSFQESNVSFPNIRESVRDEKQYKRKNSQMNPYTSVLHTPPSPISARETSEYLTFGLTPRPKEKILYNSNQQYPLSFLYDKEEDYSQYTINVLHKSEKSSSSEQYKESDAETINKGNGNIQSDVVIHDAENNKLVVSASQGLKLQKYSYNESFKSYITEKVNVSCNKRKHDYGIMRFDDLLSSSIGNRAESRSFDFFKTNETYGCIHESEDFTRPIDYEKFFLSYTRTPGYFFNTTLSEETINLNNITYEDTIHPLGEKETILDTNIHPSDINDNVDLDHSDNTHMGSSYKSMSLIQFLTEPLRKKSKHIPPTVQEDKSSSMGIIPQNIGTTNKDNIDTRNQSGTGYAFSTSYDSERDLENLDITDTNTSQKTFHDVDFNPSHLKQDIPKLVQVPIKDYDGTNNDEISLKEISEDVYNLKFILNGTLFSWDFNGTNRANLFLKLSGTPIKATEYYFSWPVRNKSINNLYWRRYVYFIPIFHTMDFVISDDIKYFIILMSKRKYKITQVLDIYINQPRSISNKKLRLKCPRIQDVKQLINKLLKTTFPIYNFSASKKHRIIPFLSLNHDLIKKEMSLNEYIKDITENPFKIEIQHANEYNPALISYIDKTKKHRKIHLGWISGIKIVYDVCMTFNKNIKKILIIIDDVSILSDYKKVKIKCLLNQIIQKIKIKYSIFYPKNENENHQRESELMSFYAFCLNELQTLFEWWNKYVFVIEKVQYIEPDL